MCCWCQKFCSGSHQLLAAKAQIWCKRSGGQSDTVTGFSLHALGITTAFTWRQWTEKECRTSVKTASLQVDIWTWYLPDTQLQCFVLQLLVIHRNSLALIVPFSRKFFGYWDTRHSQFLKHLIYKINIVVWLMENARQQLRCSKNLE